MTYSKQIQHHYFGSMNNRIWIIRKGSSEYPMKRILIFKGISVRPSIGYGCVPIQLQGDPLCMKMIFSCVCNLFDCG